MDTYLEQKAATRDDSVEDESKGKWNESAEVTATDPTPNLRTSHN